MNAIIDRLYAEIESMKHQREEAMKIIDQSNGAIGALEWALQQIEGVIEGGTG
jgi:hypothetical protein